MDLSDDPLLGDYLDEWLDRRRNHLRPTTLRCYRNTAERYLRPHLGEVPLPELDRRTLERLYGRLLDGGGRNGKPLSPRTVQLTHAVLRRALEDAHVDGLLDVNPATLARPPRRDPGEVELDDDLHVWTAEEVARFLNAVDDDPLRGVWHLAVGTGARRGELLGLRWQDVDLDGATVTIRRSLTVADGVVRLLGSAAPSRRWRRQLCRPDTLCRHLGIICPYATKETTVVNAPQPFVPTFERTRWAPGPNSGLSRRKRLPTDYQAVVPPEIAEAPVSLDSATFAACSEAATAIAGLDVAAAQGQLGPVAMSLLRSEAIASSRIERLRVSNRGVGLALHDPSRARTSAREVAGNVEAMQAALGLADERGVTVDGILAVHRRLLQGHDPQGIAGVIRQEAVWIGGSTPIEADFVPPPAHHIRPLLRDLEQFGARKDIDPITKAALLHAQFEAIHPFADGNGRVGRCLIQTSLRRDGVTSRVTVPVSTLLLHERDKYFEALAAYQQRGELDVWVAHFAIAATRAVDVSEHLGQELERLRHEWLEAAGTPRAGSIHRRLVEALPAQPVVDVASVAGTLGVDERTALRGLDRLATAEVLREITGHQRNRVWVAEDVFDVLDEVQASIGRDTDGAAPTRHLRDMP